MNLSKCNRSPRLHVTCAVNFRRAFTLVEMLVVIGIISVLLTAVGPIFNRITSSQSPATVAAAVAGQLERARSHAIAKGAYVWVRLGQVSEEPNDFYIGVYESLDGSNTPATAKGIWSAPRFPDCRLSNSLNSTFIRPAVPSADQPAAAAWIRFTPGGEAWLLAANPTQSRIRMIPPSDEGRIARWVEFGLQPTRRGKVPSSMRQNVAAVHLAGLTGQTLQFSR